MPKGRCRVIATHLRLVGGPGNTRAHCDWDADAGTSNEDAIRSR